MGKGQQGLVKRNSNYFEDILPNTIEDAKTRKLTYKQLKQVKAETKYFCKEQENFSKALKLEARQLRKQNSRIFHRRRGMLCNLRNLKKLKAEVAAIGETKWRDSLIRIENIKLKQEEYQEFQKEKERFLKNQKYKQQSCKLLEDFQWFECNSKGKSVVFPEKSLKGSNHSQSSEKEGPDHLGEHHSIQEDIIAAEEEAVISDGHEGTDIEGHEQTFDSDSGFNNDIEEKKDRLSEPIIQIRKRSSKLKGSNLIHPLCNVDALHIISEKKEVKQLVASMETLQEIVQDPSETVIRLDQHFIKNFSDFVLFRFDKIMANYDIKVRGLFYDEPVFFSLLHFKEAISSEPISVVRLKLKILPVVSEKDSSLCNLKIKDFDVAESIDVSSESALSLNWGFICHHMRRKNLWCLNRNLFYEDQSFFSSFYSFNADIIEDSERICICCSFDSDINVETILSKLLEESFNCIFIRPKRICKFLFNLLKRNEDSYNVTSSSEFNDFLSTIKTKVIQDGQNNNFSLLLESNCLLEYIQHILPFGKFCLVLYDFQPTDEQKLFLSQNFSQTYFEHFLLKPLTNNPDVDMNRYKGNSDCTILNTLCNLFRDKFNFNLEKKQTLPELVQFDERYYSDKVLLEKLQCKINSRKMFLRELVDQIRQCLQSYQDALFKKLVFQVNTGYLQKSISKFNARSCELQKNIDILKLSSKKTNAREKRLSLLNQERKRLFEEKIVFLFNIEETILMSSLDLYFDQVEHLNNMKQSLSDCIFRQKGESCVNEVIRVIETSFFDLLTVFVNSTDKVELGPISCFNQLFMILEDKHCSPNEKNKILKLTCAFPKAVESIKSDINKAYVFPKEELEMLLDKLGNYTLQKLHTSIDSIWHTVSAWNLDYQHQYEAKW